MIEETEIYEDWQQDLIEPEVMWIPKLPLAAALFCFGFSFSAWLAL